jgi:replication initiation and membrane attachment protein DnaB
MNERVEKLAELCGFRPSPSIYDRNQSFDIEKFAELIVKECLTAIDNTDTTHIYTTFDQSMVMGTIEKSKKAIKEHFGVKE